MIACLKLTLTMLTRESYKQYLSTFPRKEYFLKMRNEETEQIQKSKRSIEKIKAAINRQCMISIDVKTGLKKLEQVIDVINYRIQIGLRWKKRFRG